MGVGWDRNKVKHSDSAIWKHIYYETSSTNGIDVTAFYDDYQEELYDNVFPPDDGDDWLYMCEMDTVYGSWCFTMGSYTLCDVSQNVAFLTSSNFAEWAGEIINYEDDMPGDSLNPCIMTDLSVGVYGYSLYEIGYMPGDTVVSDEPTMWHIERTSASSLEIWDKDPQP